MLMICIYFHIRFSSMRLQIQMLIMDSYRHLHHDEKPYNSKFIILKCMTLFRSIDPHGFSCPMWILALKEEHSRLRWDWSLWWLCVGCGVEYGLFMFTVHLRIIVSGLQYNTYNQSDADGYKCPPQYRAIHDLSFSGHFLSKAICDTRIAGNSLWTNLVLEFQLPLHCVLTRHDAMGLKQQVNCLSLLDAEMLRDETQNTANQNVFDV